MLKRPLVQRNTKAGEASLLLLEEPGASVFQNHKDPMLWFSSLLWVIAAFVTVCTSSCVSNLYVHFTSQEGDPNSSGKREVGSSCLEHENWPLQAAACFSWQQKDPKSFWDFIPFFFSRQWKLNPNATSETTTCKGCCNKERRLLALASLHNVLRGLLSSTRCSLQTCLLSQKIHTWILPN